MENTKNTKVTSVENSTKKSAESKETKGTASGSEDSKGKVKDASPSEKDQTGVLAEGFCGFEDTDTPILTRSTREASKNATAILTKKSTSKLDRAEGKSDSPPDLVLFLKEGRGRAQNYSDPPRLDPESIATRRRTRVPEDPVALISRAKSAVSSEKTKKDQKESLKKERKTKVMETPESLKRLAREESKQVQASGKESSDSGSEEKTLKKTYSKGASESDIKVRSMSTSTGPEEEQPSSINRRSNRGKRNSTDEPEVEVIGETVRASPSAKDSLDVPTNYSNLGTILNKMTKNNADRRIPVVIMSKSEKGAKIDTAKPKSKKKVSSNKSPSTAVLKMASTGTPAFLAVRSSGRDDESLSKREGDSKTPKPEDKKCGTQPNRGTDTDSEVGQDVIILKVTSDIKTEGKNTLTKTKDRTVNSISGEGSSSPAEKMQMKQNILVPSNKEQAKTDTVSGMKEAAASGSSQPAVLRTIQGSSSPIKFNSVSSPIRSGLVSSTIKPSLVISSVRSNPGNQPIRPKPITSPIKSSAVMSHAKTNPIPSTIKSSSVTSPKSSPVTLPIKPDPVTSPIKSGPVTSPIKSGPVTSPIKSGPVASPIKSGPVTSPIKSITVTSPIKSGPVTSPIKSITATSPIKSGTATSPIKSGTAISPLKSGTITSPLRGGSVMSPIKYGSVTSPIKSASVTPSYPQSQKTPPFVVSMSQIVSFGGVKGSVKTANFTPSKMGLKVSSTKGTSTAQNLKRDIAPKQESCTNTSTKTDSSVGGDKSQGPQVSTHQVSHSSTQKGPILDYTDIETQEVVLGESEDSSGQVDSVGDMPAEADLLAHEEMESSSEEDTFKLPERSIVTKKESLSPEGRVALDHSYSSGGSGSSRKKSPSTYEKSLTPRPVYSNASTAKRSLDIMLHNDKINILRQMSQIFNDEKPPQQIFSDEKASLPDTDITVSSSDGEDEEANVGMRKTKENISHKGSSKTSKCITADSAKKGPSVGQATKCITGDSAKKGVSAGQTTKCITADSAKKGAGQTTKGNIVDENDTFSSECMPSKSSALEAVPKAAGDATASADAKTSSGSASSSSNKENSFGIEFTPPMKGRKEENTSDVLHVGSDSPFLGFPDPDPKVHHVPAYSLSLNEKILVQNKVGPAGEMIDVVDGFSFTSFASEQEMMSYDGTHSGKSTRAHRQWLKKKRRKRRKRLLRQKGMRPVCPKVPEEEPASNAGGSAASPKDKGATADSGAFASDDLDTFLDKNSHLNISYQIPKCKVTEEGVSKIDEEEMLESIPPPPPPTCPQSPHSPHSSPSPHSPSSPHLPRAEMIPIETQAVVGVNPNTSAMEQHSVAGAMSGSVDQYEEVNAIDILYPKEKYKYYYNKELCKETKADASDVFVRRAGKLVPLTTVLKSQKCPAPEPSTKKSVELVYVYDGGKLLTLGGSLTKINPSNSDSVRARVVLPIGVPPIPKGETVASRAKKVQAVEINEDMAKFALSALQSFHLKLEQAVDKKDDGEEKCPPVPEPSSSAEKDEKMEVDTPEATPVEKSEIVAVPKTVPFPVPIKPTKTNILDIIAAKLAMSDEESDGKEEAEEKEAAGDLKEAATKPVTIEEKEEGAATIKEENKNVEIDLTSLGTSEKSKVPFVKQEVLKEEKSEDTEAVKPQDLENGEAVEPKSEVKQEGEAQTGILLSNTVDDTVNEEDKLTPSTEATELVNLDEKEEEENESEPQVIKESSKASNSKQSTENNSVNDVTVVGEKIELSEPVIQKEKEKEGEVLSLKGKDSVSGVDSEKKDKETEPVVLLEKEKETELQSSENKEHVSKVSEEKYDKSELITLEEKGEESKLISQEEKKRKSKTINLEENDIKSDVVVVEKKDSDVKAACSVGSMEKSITLGEEGSSSKNPVINLKGKKVGEDKEAETEQREDSTLNEIETEIDKASAAAVLVLKTSANPPSETCKNEAQGNISGEGNLTPPKSVPNSDTEEETPKSTLLSLSQEFGDRIDPEEKGESPKLGTQEALRMDIKSRVFKKNMYRFPSLSREMKRLNMNFVNYEPPQETVPEKEEDLILEFKEDCTNEHCKLGCVCDSLLCQRKNVEHCGRVECMFDCTCRDESWKLPSGSGRTMNAVSIFNLDREQNEGLALREKDFRRTVIQTGSEVILVGAERKKREIRLPGRYRETTVWTDADMMSDANNFFEPPDLPLQPDYPGIPLSEASKYIKKFKLNIPWYDIKGISVWCMDHSCYDCRCLIDPTFSDPIKVESPRKNTSSRVKPESSVLKSVDDPSTSTSSALHDFEKALKQKATLDTASSSDDKEVKKFAFVADANCSIMNIIVNNSETRRKYTWKLKEWYHYTDGFCARTAGYTKKKITEETKNMTLTGLAARDTTPEQIVESVVRSLRQQKSNEELKLPTLPCSNNFEPFMGDSLTNLQNAIGLNPDNTKKPTRAETSCPLVDLTTGNEEISSLPKHFAKPKKGPSQDIVGKSSKDLKGNIKRRLSGSAEPPSKKAHLTKPEEGAQVAQGGSSTQSSFLNIHQFTSKEHAPPYEQKLTKRTLSLLEMMIAEENRGELELDLSSNIPGNALLVAEARFRKLINMNIIGVIGINKAGRCIIGTVDSDEALQVMHQIQNMIRNNTLDVGPNMREIFFPPPYVGIRPRYVMIRCDSHHKWEIVGVVQKKGPVRSPNKASEHKTKANSSSKSQVPQVIDLEEEEMQKQLLGSSDDMKQEEEIDMVEPPSPEEKDSGAWEGSLPLIASVHSASDSNMAELIGSPEATQEEPEEPQSAQVTPTSLSYGTSPTTHKALPDLVPITSSSSVDTLSHKEEQAENLSLEAQATESENISQQKLYFVPTAFNVSSTTTTTVPSIPTDTPMKSITLNMASNKVFGNKPEKPPSSPRSFSYGKVSYILPKLPGLGKNDSSTLSSKQRDFKNPTVSKAEEGCDTDSGQATGTPASPSKMLYIPVTTGCVSKVLLVPTVSGGSSSHMMLLPTHPGTSSLESSSTSSCTTTTSTIITTPIVTSTTTATITTSKMKMVLVPSPQDGNKMLLIPAAPDGSDGAAASSAIGNSLAEGERKKMLVLPSSVISNFMSRTSSSDPATTQPYQQSCTGTLFVPLPNTGNLPNTFQLSEREKCSQQGDSHSQDSSDDVVVIGPTTNSLTITRMRTSSESCAVREETPSLLISPAPIASSSGVAETNVVSSLTTISSTIQENALSPESNSEVPSPVKQLSTVGLNTLFDKTHEEMVSDTKPVEEGLLLESAKEGACESEKEGEKGPTKVTVHSQNLNTGKTKDAQDQKKQVLIKKGGFHWSAVDLSLNFKSVKLEWLLGTIRKNVLMNIYQMSKKTHSPVTLSVKNGTSTSMLYGFARTCKSSTLPILILGSVVSAVLSSSSVPDSMLFQINSIKYFIRESTGELSSYTYSSETHLVKLASKKRGNAGEMIGIGEKIEIYKMREPAYQSHSEKADLEPGKALGSFSSAEHIAQAKGGCSCKEAGDFMCLEHCASASSSKLAEVESTPTHYPGEDSSSRVSLENDSLHASLGFQDIPVAKIHHQERDPIPVNTKLPIATKKFHSELRHLLTKSKDQPRMKKAMLGINTKGPVTYTNDDNCQVIATKKSTPVGKGKGKAKGESYTSVYDVALHQTNSENYEEIVVPKVECELGEDEGVDVDVDVLGDIESSQTILSDLRQQLELETNQVQKIASSFTSSREIGRRKVLKVPQDGPPLKKARKGMSSSGVERPCPRSRKASVSGKVKKHDPIEVVETAGKEEHQDKDTVDPSSRCPSHLAHLRPSAAEDSPIMLEENDSDTCILSKGKICALNAKQSQLMAALSRTKQKEKMLLDGEGQGDERNTEVHNKLERMRRRVMRHLFMHLQRVIVKVPRNPLITHTVTHPKKTILCAGQKVCEILKNEELRLTMEEEKIRNERSALIKHLAGIIGDSTEEIKVKWRHWVRDHMQNPSSKQAFQNMWQPFCLEKDILKNILEENTFDMDFDEGSPLPEGSPVAGPSSPQGSVDKLVPQKTKRQPGKKIFKKRGKKVGRPHKIVVNTGQQGVAFSSETTSSIPTSILLMAGTSSRGRKIVRKEDTNFVTS